MPRADLILLRAAVLTTFAVLSGSVGAQSAGQWIQWGDDAMARGDHYGASRFYGNALEADGGKMEAQWKMAEACRLCHRYPEAEANYTKVVQKDRTRMHPEAQLHLAEMLMCNGKYKEAEEAWKKLKQREKDKKSFGYLRAEQGIAGCALAKAMKDSTSTLAVVNLGEPVNSYDSDFGARFGPDSTLWFSSLRGEVNDDGEVEDTGAYHVRVYSAAKHGAAWNPPMMVQASPDAMGSEHANLFWADATRQFFTMVAPDGRRAVAHRLSGAAGQPLSGLAADANTTQPWVARINDREVLFFASDRPDGRGGMDIWLADLDGTEVSNVRNAGPLVNSPGNETCPAFDEHTGTLWFSSDFHAGLGGYDVFRSAWKNDLFNAPENAGVPINSPANDLYPVFNDKTGEGWLTSNRIGSLAKKGETCCNDLYRWKLPRVQPPPPDTTAMLDSVALVPVRKLIEYLPLKLYFHNDEPDPRSWSTTTEHQYDSTWFRYKAMLPQYEREFAGMLDGDARGEAVTSVGNFFGNEAQAGYDKVQQFMSELQGTLEQGRQVNLLVRGFASPLAKSDYNVNLSLRRIQSLVNLMRAWNAGALAPYLDGTAPNGGRLTIERAPFGEEKAKSGVSDNLRDQRKSVYDPDAARERRIEIERAVISGASGETLLMEQQVKRVGKLKEGEPVEFVFDIKNSGDQPLRILSVKADCGCTTAVAPEEPISPGATIKLPVQFSGRAPQGEFRRTVRLLTDGEPAEIELILSGTIVPGE